MLSLAVFGLAVVPQMAHAKMRTLTVRSNTLWQTTWVNPGTRLVLENNVTLSAKKQLVLNGGVLVVRQRLVIPSGQAVIVYDGELDGDGEVEVSHGAYLYFAGGRSKHLKNITIVNKGQVSWGGMGRIDCDSGTTFRNDGTMYLSNGKPSHDRGEAQFINRGMIMDVSRGQGATIDGNLINYGRIELNEADAPTPRRSHRGRKKPGSPMAMPTPSLVVITGTFGSSSGTFQTTIRSDYYGQLYTSSSVSLGGTFKYVLDPTSHVPPNANVYDIIVAGAIGSSNFSSFTSTPTPFLFATRKYPTTSPKKFQLYSYN
jgi:hypothetical protein